MLLLEKVTGLSLLDPQFLKRLGILESEVDDVWQFQAIADNRCCKACSELDGEMYLFDYIRSVFPYAIYNPELIYPMVHPNCRCAMVDVTGARDNSVFSNVNPPSDIWATPIHGAPMSPSASSAYLNRILAIMKAYLNRILAIMKKQMASSNVSAGDIYPQPSD